MDSPLELLPEPFRVCSGPGPAFETACGMPAFSFYVLEFGPREALFEGQIGVDCRCPAHRHDPVPERLRESSYDEVLVLTLMAE